MWGYNPADFDRDGLVDAADVAEFSLAYDDPEYNSQWAVQPDPQADFDTDGDVDLADYLSITNGNNLPIHVRLRTSRS